MGEDARIESEFPPVAKHEIQSFEPSLSLQRITFYI